MKKVIISIVVSLFTFLSIAEARTPLPPAPRHNHAYIRVEAPVADVYQHWTTEEGQEAFFKTEVILERKTNGLYEVHFLPDAEPGMRGHEDGRILALQENKMFAFTWVMPPYMEEIRPHHTYVQVWFTEVDEDTTDINLYHMGFGEGPAWDEGFKYFSGTWQEVLKLYKAYAEEK